jgi:hypothetical protein
MTIKSHTTEMYPYRSRNLQLLLNKNEFIFIGKCMNELDFHHSVTNNVLRTERGRAIAQAVSRWLPTAAARVQTRV